MGLGTSARIGVYIYTMAINPLTDRQQEVLDFLSAHFREHGMAPTVSEIAQAFGLSSPFGITRHLKALQTKGAITVAAHKARGIRLTTHRRRQRPDQLQLPVLGRVAAGLPIGADIGLDEKLLLDRNCFEQTPDYLLRIQGDSMIEDGILDGDLVAIKRTPEALSGQIVVARIDGEITIKRLKLTKLQILLLPRNPDYAPIRVPADADFAIEGIYCGLVRRS